MLFTLFNLVLCNQTYIYSSSLFQMTASYEYFENQDMALILFWYFSQLYE